MLCLASVVCRVVVRVVARNILDPMGHGGWLAFKLLHKDGGFVLGLWGFLQMNRDDFCRKSRGGNEGETRGGSSFPRGSGAHGKDGAMN